MEKKYYMMVTTTKSVQELNAKLDQFFRYADDHWDFLHRIMGNLVEKYGTDWDDQCEIDLPSDLSDKELALLDDSAMITVKRLLREMGIAAKVVHLQENEGSLKMVVVL